MRLDLEVLLFLELGFEPNRSKIRKIERKIELTKIQLQPLLMTILLSLAFVACCSKNSSTDSGTDSGTDSTKDCGKGASCEGTYSTSSSDSKVWTGVCEVKQVDSGEWTKIWFVRPMKNCGFKWIRAQKNVGTDWASLASGADREFMVEHTGEDVFTLRLCEDGGNSDNSDCL